MSNRTVKQIPLPETVDFVLFFAGVATGCRHHIDSTGTCPRIFQIRITWLATSSENSGRRWHPRDVNVWKELLSPSTQIDSVYPRGLSQFAEFFPTKPAMPEYDLPSLRPDSGVDPATHVRPAARVLRLPPYMFGRINRLLYEKRRAGHDVIDLGMGNPSNPPEGLVIDKLAEAARDPRNHGYSDSNGILNLRREVASKYLKKYGVRLDPETQVMTCLGSKEGFSHMCLAMMGPGDTAIVPAPYFPVHMYAVALASGNVIAIEVANSEKFLSNVAYTCQHLFPKPKILIINFPHNPSTATVESDFYEDVVRLAKKHEFLVINDFAYADVGFDGYQPPSFLAAKGATKVGVEFTTMSKGYNMAGWRVGFCCGNAELIRNLGIIKGYYDYGMFQAVQIAAIVALRHTEAAVERQATIYKNRRDVLVDGLQRIGWNMERPKAGMFVWAEVPPAHLEVMDTMDFSMMLLDRADVAVSPGTGFGEAGEGYLRLALVENENRLRQAVRQIGRCLDAPRKFDRQCPESNST